MKTNSEEEGIVVASEIAQIYHAVKHNHSYNSLDCGLKLNSKLNQDSKVAAKVSCGRTKSEAIVTNVLGKKALGVVMDDLKQHDPPLFFALQTDASNIKKQENVPCMCSVFQHGTWHGKLYY